MFGLDIILRQLNENISFNKFFCLIQMNLLYVVEFKDITAEMEIKDGYGRSKLAIDVYSAVLNDLKQKALTYTRRKNIEEIDITWIMTVPDVWNKSARDFIQLSCESVS